MDFSLEPVPIVFSTGTTIWELKDEGGQVVRSWSTESEIKTYYNRIWIVPRIIELEPGTYDILSAGVYYLHILGSEAALFAVRIRD